MNIELLIPAIGAFGLACLRISWSLEGRRPIVNTIGWAAILGSLACSAMAAGAWGVAMVSVLLMNIAVAIVAASAVTSSPLSRQFHPIRNTSKRPHRLVPPLRLIGQLWGLFLLSLALALAGAICVSALGMKLGASLADSSAIYLILYPLFVTLGFTLTAMWLATVFTRRRPGRSSITAQAVGQSR